LDVTAANVCTFALIRRAGGIYDSRNFEQIQLKVA
jgi:hypothetical protein